jgi:hypothetical protein
MTEGTAFVIAVAQDRVHDALILVFKDNVCRKRYYFTQEQTLELFYLLYKRGDLLHFSPAVTTQDVVFQFYYSINSKTSHG